MGNSRSNPPIALKLGSSNPMWVLPCEVAQDLVDIDTQLETPHSCFSNYNLIASSNASLKAPFYFLISTILALNFLPNSSSIFTVILTTVCK